MKITSCGKCGSQWDADLDRSAHTCGSSVQVKSSKTTVKTTWRCAQCGAKLPKRGQVWSWRFGKHTEGKPSAYVCDPCADVREFGGEDGICNAI